MKLRKMTGVLVCVSALTLMFGGTVFAADNQSIVDQMMNQMNGMEGSAPEDENGVSWPDEAVPEGNGEALDVGTPAPEAVPYGEGISVSADEGQDLSDGITLETDVQGYYEETSTLYIPLRITSSLDRPVNVSAYMLHAMDVQGKELMAYVEDGIGIAPGETKETRIGVYLDYPGQEVSYIEGEIAGYDPDTYEELWHSGSLALEIPLAWTDEGYEEGDLSENPYAREASDPDLGIMPLMDDPEAAEMSGGALAAILGMGFLLFGVLAAYGVYMIICMWKLFDKAGYAPWKCLIPLYNTWCLFEAVWGSGAKMFLLLIPFANFVILIMTMFKIAKAFGKGAGFGFGLLFLQPIFMGILAFGSAEYEIPD